ncbi:adenosylhomocysteinase [Candidatus Micrarchaeota archaeon CG08_land_8_20_14_0_20_49_17]|nr:MAG: adenosylhomocysteinase [Candidatus Micrarchaeota archaeon CG08_land_8_20_14_0_20_49_17]PIZ99470.1 MAG: adenosylhomocysteinase [Candidatus Micrarchaeota archaeon CG_4_10_14_0_2_um_filter_49_7]
MDKSAVKDLSLAPKGEKEFLWAYSNMPLLKEIGKRFGKERPFEGMKIGVALHLEKKTAVLLYALKEGGAEVIATSCNPLTTDDRIAAYLASIGITVYAWAGETKKEYDENIDRVASAKPQIVIDDGADLIALMYKNKEYTANLIGACEETTTGVIRLKAMESEGKLALPVIAVNNAYSKHLFDNYYGTGQSTVEAVMRATNKLIAGKKVVVVGYGWCGKGIAQRFRGMGAHVTVVEAGYSFSDKAVSGYHKGLQALYDGFEVRNMNDACKIGDIFITATGNKSVISLEHLKLMKNGAIVANAGHFNVEIDIESLEKIAKRKRIKENIDAYEFNGKTVYLLAEGRLVNLAQPTGQGHPIEIMDGSFAIQALCCEHLVNMRGKLKPKVHDVPFDIDELVARLILENHGVKLEKPTKEQIDYSKSWDL